MYYMLVQKGKWNFVSSTLGSGKDQYIIYKLQDSLLSYQIDS